MTQPATASALEVEDRFLTHNYHPLPVVAKSAKGAWVVDVEGKKYLDCLAAYSAVNFGHGNPARSEERRVGKECRL